MPATLNKSLPFKLDANEAAWQFDKDKRLWVKAAEGEKLFHYGRGFGSLRSKHFTVEGLMAFYSEAEGKLTHVNPQKVVPIKGLSAYEVQQLVSRAEQYSLGFGAPYGPDAPTTPAAKPRADAPPPLAPIERAARATTVAARPLESGPPDRAASMDAEDAALPGAPASTPASTPASAPPRPRPSLSVESEDDDLTDEEEMEVEEEIDAADAAHDVAAAAAAAKLHAQFDVLTSMVNRENAAQFKRFLGEVRKLLKLKRLEDEGLVSVSNGQKRRKLPGRVVRMTPFALDSVEDETEEWVVAAKVKDYIPTYRSIVKLTQMAFLDWSNPQLTDDLIVACFCEGVLGMDPRTVRQSTEYTKVRFDDSCMALRSVLTYHANNFKAELMGMIGNRVKPLVAKHSCAEVKLFEVVINPEATVRTAYGTNNQRKSGEAGKEIIVKASGQHLGLWSFAMMMNDGETTRKVAVVGEDLQKPTTFFGELLDTLNTISSELNADALREAKFYAGFLPHGGVACPPPMAQRWMPVVQLPFVAFTVPYLLGKLEPTLPVINFNHGFRPDVVSVEWVNWILNRQTLKTGRIVVLANNYRSYQKAVQTHEQKKRTSAKRARHARRAEAAAAAASAADEA